MKQDNDILHRLKSSDIKAFNDLFDLFFGHIFNFLCSIVKDREAAEDLAQDIFLKIWEKRFEINTDAPIDAYMFVMAKNSALNYLRRKKSQQDYANHEIAISEKVIEHENSYVAKDTLSIIERLVEDMPQQRKKIFRMSRTDGMSHKEIAKELSISVDTVESHIKASLRQIKKIAKI